ncbi:nicotinate-nucleotide adenylyltransferase [Ferrimonas senticii]|uniref:nicotinate-nucleotide adenylyltransferase n=1 Tax=Ferrimonas senticii TaxID=394566 RepID=UPI0004267B47|nr:nicotinate-nucleotide adenylyltransferase [Ferrimonas senticii]
MTITHLGLLGGTFDPIHQAHLECALAVQQALKLDRVDLLPNAVPPHKASPGVSAAQRLAMVKLAIADYPQLGVDDRELARSGHSYSVDTLAQLKAEQPDTRLYFIAGMDSLLSFHHWHQWQRILQLCHLVICYRPGYPLPQQPQTQGATMALLSQHQVADVAALRQRDSGGILLLEGPQLDIASSDIRRQLSGVEPVNLGLPAAVLTYIHQQRLYR